VDVAAFGNQGRRKHMEDSVRMEHPYMGRQDWLYAGVCDGHTGDVVARRASQELHGLLTKEFEIGQPFAKALPVAFHAFDDAVAGEPGGTTATTLLFVPGVVVVANVGDSEAVLVSQDGASTLTTLHRVANGAELQRVLAAGARISGPYACLPTGKCLMTTRSLGDRTFRGIGIVPDPDVAIRPFTPGDEWVVAATDGVWDVVGPKEVGPLIGAAETAAEAARRVVEAVLLRARTT